ncbi:uncharacterized protein RCH25_050421 [Pelodytes ibericus]
MSQSIMRKAQPFTIGTRLSIPKCADFPASGSGGIFLESPPLSQNLSQRVSCYRRHASPSSDSYSPPAPHRGTLHPHSPSKGVPDEDRFGEGSLARSIKKITLSSQGEDLSTDGVVKVSPRVLALNSERNFNNNNSRPLRHVVPSCEGPPCPQTVRNYMVGPWCPQQLQSHGPTSDPVLRDISGPQNDQPRKSSVPDLGGPLCPQLGRDSVAQIMGLPSRHAVRADTMRTNGVESRHNPTDHVKGTESPYEVYQRENVPMSGAGGVVTAGRRRPSLDNRTSQIAQLVQDIIQAESWIRGKLQDVKDRWDADLLLDWEQGSHSIQKDITGFEITIMKLNQIGEHFLKIQAPNAPSLRVQLQSLRDQWQLLKQTATNQSKAMGSAKTLQEFNKKADELEIWMREKEEAPPLPVLLDEHLDKVQLTRQILALKQEQLYYRSLQENINSLAQKLEKQGRAESKGSCTRRKQLNKMWVRLQDTLQEYQHSLQMALEASSLWQQADCILRAMDHKVINGGGGGDRYWGQRNEGNPEGHEDLRDIGSQIMMLDIAVSQISSLHPVLALRAGLKQRQVKESWAQLLQSLRTDKSMRPILSPTLTGESDDPPTPATAKQCSVGNQPRGILGRQGGQRDVGSPKPKNGPLCSTQREATGSEVISVCPAETKRRQTVDREKLRRVCRQEVVQCDPHSETPEVSQLLSELSSTDQWLQRIEFILSEPAAMRSPEVIRRNLREVSILEKEVKSRGLTLQMLGAKVRGSSFPERALSEETKEKVHEVKDRVQMAQDALRRRASDLRDTLVLSEFMKIVQMEEERRKKEMAVSVGAVREGPCDLGIEGRELFSPLEELQEAVEMLNDAAMEREKAVTLSKEAEDLQSGVSTLSQMIRRARSWLDDIRKQTEDTERDFAAVKSLTDLKDLQELFIQHQELEYDISGPLQLEVTRLEEQLDKLQDLSSEKSRGVKAEINETLQDWAQLQERVRESKARLQSTDQLRGFFLSYLEMISWTEETRAQIFSEATGDRLVPLCSEELERRIEGKLRVFESLAGVGWRFIGEGHFLAQTIKERMEELQGMLSWVLMRWRCRKQQRIMGHIAEKRRVKEVSNTTFGPKGHPPTKEVHQVTTSCISPEAFESLEDVGGSSHLSPPTRGPTLRRYGRKAHSPMSLEGHLSKISTGSEVDFQTGAQPLEESLGLKRSDGPVWLEPKEMPSGSETTMGEDNSYTLYSPKSVGSSTFWKRCQGLLESTISSLKRKKRVSLPVVEEVSTYLHVKSDQSTDPTCHSMTVPRPTKQPWSQDQYSIQCAPDSGDFSIPLPKIPPQEEVTRCTGQGIIALYSDDRRCSPKDGNALHTHTWPPKRSRNVPASESNLALGIFTDYVRNPLTANIDDECEAYASALKKSDTVRKGLDFGVSPTLPATCRRLALGSVLSLEIPKEAKVAHLNLLDSVTEGGAGQTKATGSQDTSFQRPSPDSRSWIEGLSSSTGYCRQNLHGYGKSTHSPKPHQLEHSNECLIDFELGRISPIGTLNKDLEPEWKRLKDALIPSQTEEDSRMKLTVVERKSADLLHHPLVLDEATEVVSYLKEQCDETASHGSSVRLSNTDIKICTQLCEPMLIGAPQPCRLQNHQAGKQMLQKAGFTASTEVLHPDHEFLEQDDEELEGIWNNAKRGRVGCSSYTSDTIRDGEAEQGGSAKTLEHETRRAPHGQSVTLTSPKKLVATFTLPTLSRVSQYSKLQSGNVEPTEREHEGVNHTGFHQQQGPGNGPPAQASNAKTLETAAKICKGEETQSTTGINTVKLPQRLDFQLMEGPLEKKRTLQPGGRKASSRAWSMYHAVLVRRTLCFYHDRKLSTKSSVSASSLHLTGALCTPDTHYTKRDNCFCLRLSDGSEYLLRAPSSPLLQEWVSKLQHNAGLEDTDLLRDSKLGSDLSPRHLLRPRSGPFRSWIPQASQLIPTEGREIRERVAEIHQDQTQTGDHANGCKTPAKTQLLYWLPADSASGSCSLEEGNVPMGNRRRSQSFSSVSYQKMASFPSSQEAAPRYSVTLYIGDSPAPSRARCHSFATSPDQPSLGWSREASGIQKPRNLSVFKKFFRKKE